MKRIVIILAVFSMVGLPNTAFAHPGNTATDGCHYCRTNCDSWGVPWNERHCHVSYDPPTMSLPDNGNTNTSNIVTTPTQVSPPIKTTAKKAFIGIPKTKKQLLRCPVVANKKSKIYHLKGTKYIKTMTVKNKRCYATTEDAKKAGYRKTK